MEDRWGGGRSGGELEAQAPEDKGRLAVLEGRMQALELENRYLRWGILGS